jgi:hypothetical protein
MLMGGRLPFAMVLHIRRRFSIPTFVETGTFQMASAGWAAQHFAVVHTVESDESLYEGALRHCAREGLSNVHVHFGSSAVLLPQVLDAVPRSPGAVFWLDAHWLGQGDPPAVECPVLFELGAIRAWGGRAFVFLDDMRFFSGELPKGYGKMTWPSCAEVQAALPEGNGWAVRDDVLSSAPRSVVPPSMFTVDSFLRFSGETEPC